MTVDSRTYRVKRIVWVGLVCLAVAGAIPLVDSMAGSSKEAGSVVAGLPSQAALPGGGDIDENSVTAVMKVDGMSCSGCVFTIQSALSEIEGIRNVDVNVAAGRAEVTYDGRTVKDPEVIARAITDSGYPATIIQTLTADAIREMAAAAAARARNHIAAVGAYEISRADFDTELNHARNRYIQVYGETVFTGDQGEALLNNLKAQIATRLIDEGVQLQEILKSGFSVDAADVDVEFERFLAARNTDRAAFESELAQSGYPLDFFRQKFETRVRIQRYLDTNVFDEAATDQEKQQRYAAWFNNARLLASVEYYDKDLERIVRSSSASSGCSGGGGGCSGGGCSTPSSVKPS